MRSETGRWTLEEVRDGSGTLREVRDGLGYRRGGPGWVLEVRDVSRHPQGSPGRVGGPLGRSETVSLTLREVPDGSGEP